MSAHHPHALRPVQSSHDHESAQGSVVPPHSLEYQSQSPQLPTSGPPELPCMQVLLEAHQPQTERVVQSSHEPESAQGSSPPQSKEYQSQSEQLPADGPE